MAGLASSWWHRGIAVNAAVVAPVGKKVRAFEQVSGRLADIG